MRKGPKRSFHKDISRITNSTLRQSRESTQHGQHIPLLLCLPSESLTYITSFLDPVSLCSLAQTSRKLYEHVSDDNTWRRAFVCQVLGILPEEDLNEVRPLTFRSTQKTWRHEFGRRHIIRGLWSRSNNPMISHRPVIPTISVIHVMADYGLLSACTDHCVVARSFPFRNEVLKGYLYGTGIPPGLGQHLPATAFMPRISACALASDGTTAKAIWARQDGSVIIVSHPRTMTRTQSPAHILTSSAQQEHEGAVLDATWAAAGNAFVTAGSDGRIKVWAVAPFCCAWTSDIHFSGQGIAKVVEDLANGLVVAASRSGDHIILSGFDASSLGRRAVLPHDIQKLCVPVRTFPTPVVEPASDPQPMEISALSFQTHSPTRLSILAYYLNTSRFYRCSVDLLNERVHVKTFGDAGFGTIRCIQPAFSDDPMEPSFVLAGTRLGVVSIYDWDTTAQLSDSYPASRHVDVFSDAQVTSLALNPFVIVAGSSYGGITVLDLLTLETLRSFPATVKTAVQQIELVGDLLVANVGSRVLAWSAYYFMSSGKNSVRTKGKGKQGGHKKWFENVELRSDIADTRNFVEKCSSKRSLLPEHEQLMQLYTLGLSEQEAVEYTLMLSRDEELLRCQSSIGEHVDEGIFDTDESSRDQPTSLHGHVVPMASPSNSNIKVQVSPRFKPEPKEAGGLVNGPLDPQSTLPSPPPPFSQSILEQTSPRVITPSKQVCAVDSSYERPNAWSKPLPGTGLSALPPAQTGQPLPSALQTHWEDLELRFALEMSLAEARSRENEKEKDTGGT